MSNTPLSCNCGTPFSVDHAMICHMGGIPTIRHNDITATLLTEICCNRATPSTPQQPTQIQMLALTSAPEGFGMQARTHFLMLGFFTQTRLATAPRPLLLHTASMRHPRRENTPNAYVMWSTVYSHYLCSLQREEWAVKQQHFIRD